LFFCEVSDWTIAFLWVIGRAHFCEGMIGRSRFWGGNLAIAFFVGGWAIVFFDGMIARSH
jgi:hypothetical protein